MQILQFSEFDEPINGEDIDKEIEPATLHPIVELERSVILESKPSISVRFSFMKLPISLDILNSKLLIRKGN